MNRLLLWLCVALWAAVLVWAAAVYYCSSLSGAQLAAMVPSNAWDKALHFLTFFAGGVLLAWALTATGRWRMWNVLVASALTLAIYGALDEWHQLHTPGRSGGDVQDWIADTLGALTGSTVFCFLYARRYPQKTTPAPAGD